MIAAHAHLGGYAVGGDPATFFPGNHFVRAGLAFARPADIAPEHTWPS
jgi:hypothetical protein